MGTAPGQHIEGWMTAEELTFLHEMAGWMDSVAEIGSWKGRSTFSLCSSGCPRVIAVDHFQGSRKQREKIKGLNLQAEFRQNVGHFENLQVLAMSSEQAASKVDAVDMVFIDAGHEYESVLQDIKLWAPKARKVVCGHDWNHPAWPGVQRACREYFRREPDAVVAPSIWVYHLHNDPLERHPPPHGLHTIRRYLALLRLSNYDALAACAQAELVAALIVNAAHEFPADLKIELQRALRKAWDSYSPAAGPEDVPLTLAAPVTAMRDWGFAGELLAASLALHGESGQRAFLLALCYLHREEVETASGFLEIALGFNPGQEEYLWLRDAIAEKRQQQIVEFAEFAPPDVDSRGRKL